MYAHSISVSGSPVLNCADERLHTKYQGIIAPEELLSIHIAQAIKVLGVYSLFDRKRNGLRVEIKYKGGNRVFKGGNKVFKGGNKVNKGGNKVNKGGWGKFKNKGGNKVFKSSGWK